jgi:hypothetical protein
MGQGTAISWSPYVASAMASRKLSAGSADRSTAVRRVRVSASLRRSRIKRPTPARDQLCRRAVPIDKRAQQDVRIENDPHQARFEKRSLRIPVCAR